MSRIIHNEKVSIGASFVFFGGTNGYGVGTDNISIQNADVGTTHDQITIAALDRAKDGPIKNTVLANEPAFLAGLLDPEICSNLYKLGIHNCITVWL